MTKSSKGASKDITADLAALRRDVARLSDSISGLLQNQAQGAAQHVSDAVDDVKVKFASTVAAATSRVNAAGGEIEAGIERNPMSAMLITFAVGMGLGMVLGMVRRSRH
jgi:ElaB/YqjD/DUF883 family membrane-anchored ribosome-binding protein